MRLHSSHSWFCNFQPQCGKLTAISDVLDSFIFNTTLILLLQSEFCYFITEFSHICTFNLYIFIITSPWLSNKSLDVVSLEVTLLQVILLSFCHQIQWKNNLCPHFLLFHLYLTKTEFCQATILKLRFQCMCNFLNFYSNDLV